MGGFMISDSCECCQKEPCIVLDYRPKKDLWEKGHIYNYKTPVGCYQRPWVCNSCFHIDDKEFFKRSEKNEKNGKKT